MGNAATYGIILPNDDLAKTTNGKNGMQIGTRFDTLTVYYNAIFGVGGASPHHILNDIMNYGTIFIIQCYKLYNFPGMNSDANMINLYNLGSEAFFEFNDANAKSPTSINWDLENFHNSGLLQLCGRGLEISDMTLRLTAKSWENMGYMTLEQYNTPMRNYVKWAGGDTVINRGMIRLVNTRLKMGSEISGGGCINIFNGGNVELVGENDQTFHFNPVYGLTTFLVGKEYYANNNNPKPIVMSNYQSNCALLFYDTPNKLAYDSQSGILTVSLPSADIKFDIGTGYDPSGFKQKKASTTYENVVANVYYIGASTPVTLPQCIMADFFFPVCAVLPTTADGLEKVFRNYFPKPPFW